MMITEINLIVEDLARSHAFYSALGCELRPVSDSDEDTTAWLSDGGPVPVALHSTEFAAWWDSSEPPVAPGSTTIDLTLDSAGEIDALLATAEQSGGTVIAAARPMPWGQQYAIFADPDGYRWGIKSPPRQA
ncbi:VOC family protein [Microlunatus sp. GCM10028923]|uniref:VOC family protein n=1 Tax=Microlunatus sp. GCM10028923 TaxID=3273400 RepID=UPI00361009D7